MTLALIGFVIVSALELLLWLPSFWRWRKILADVLGLLLTIASAVLVGYFPNVWVGVLLLLSVYRVINLLRVSEGNSQPDYMFAVARRTSLWLIGVQTLMGGLSALHNAYGIGVLPYIYALAVVQLVVAILLFLSTQRQLKKTRPPVIEEAYADRDLPSLSVLIPARNETTDLQECLDSLLMSTYPKLEILVLDDCSQDRHTSEIIRQYAQEGVRFIGGEVPPSHWVAKNYAYEQLVQQASGELFLFCGVDTRFEPDSLRVLVETLLTKKKHMMCVMPRNLSHKNYFRSLLVQPDRYAWEVTLPRRFMQRPPVLSTCWLITRSTLRAAGGFKAVSRSHAPESHFAKYAASAKDGYSFIQSSKQIGLVSVKNITEQLSTAVRTRYPQMHRRVELVAFTTLCEAGFLLAPFGLLVFSVVTSNWALVACSLPTNLLLLSIYTRVVTVTYRSFKVGSLFTAPIAAMYDICLLQYSMCRYEFGEVVWKGRNVCVPVMRALPRNYSDRS